MKGYKAFHSDLTCRGFQYKIGETYEMNDSPIVCERGFHFCTDIASCYNYYPMDEWTRICEVEAIGDIVGKENKYSAKYCTNKIRIIREITDYSRNANVNKYSSGYRNSGTRNSGNGNSGSYNYGRCNAGNRNYGDYNCGTGNIGDWNTGECNVGNFNTGSCNCGYKNSGMRNIGDRNSGDWNFGNYNSGIFNTDDSPKIKMFDKESLWTYDTWRNSVAYDIMITCPRSYSTFIYEKDMTDIEKRDYPSYKIDGGYVKIIRTTTSDRQGWWDNLSSSDKETIKALPNFDADKFCACVGLYHI